MADSRISGFYKNSLQERLRLLHQKGVLNNEDFALLKNGKSLVEAADTDKMVENVIGVFGLPFGLGLNFLVNDKDYIVPMVVEEPSIIAALSAAAKLVRSAGGFKSEMKESILIGQIQVVDIKNTSKAKQSVIINKEEIINLANSLHPNMTARGGGAVDLEVKILSRVAADSDMLIVHLLVDTKDAMGANLVNSMCEGVAPLVEKISGGRVFLRILSNLADRSLVHARCKIPVDLLAGKGFSGEDVRDGIILAYRFAAADPYRAATHNKGILNGIDPLVIATGNDWRAIEAGAHAYAARAGRYTSLTKWGENENGDLAGTIEIPIRVGIVGGPLESNPMVPIAHRILGIKSARELAELMGAVGLAQNMSALRALATEGIQRGHMSLHARSVVMAAGAYPEIFESVVEKLIDSSEIKVWKAKEIIEELAGKKVEEPEIMVLKRGDAAIPTGYGKVIFLGEHAVVYGSHALAAPVPLAMQAKVTDSDKDGIHLIIPRWGVEEQIRRGEDHKHSIFKSLDLILEKLDLHDRNIKIEVFPQIPRAMGLGGSAALAVAIIRALAAQFNMKLTDKYISDLAYASETIVHGKASGIDNTLATYGEFLLFRKGEPNFLEPVKPKQPIRLVIGLTWVQSLTVKMVTKVNNAWTRNKKLYTHVFDEINNLTLQAVQAVRDYDLEKLGDLMNINQGYLNALQVSTKEIEELIEIARNNGALGAKLTGSGGGGAIIALCPDNAAEVVQAMKEAGYKAMVTDIG